MGSTNWNWVFLKNHYGNHVIFFFILALRSLLMASSWHLWFLNGILRWTRKKGWIFGVGSSSWIENEDLNSPPQMRIIYVLSYEQF